MKYALVNNARMEAYPGASGGTCPVCGCRVIAKCGDSKISHWAHYGVRTCDPWWENETEWHRNWKNFFPRDWQEFIQHDDSGEKHIADVKTCNGWVIEFQHSYLDPEERRVRGSFYKNLVWVVDGTRRTLDSKQFFRAIEESLCLTKSPHVIQEVFINDSRLLKEWSSTDLPVLFDFRDESKLWLLLPEKTDRWVYVTIIPKADFINIHNEANNSQDDGFGKILNNFKKVILREHLYREEREELALRSRQYREQHPLESLMQNHRRRSR